MIRALGLLVVVALAAAFPAAARADRSYGAVGSGGGDLVTLRLSDSGRSLRALTLRVELHCLQGGVTPFAGTLRVVDRLPARIRNRGLAIRRRAGRGTVVARLRARYGSKRSHVDYMGSLRIDRIGARSARLRLTLLSIDTDYPTDPCGASLRLGARRAPGVLYVGATSDEEPIWLRRQTATSLEVVAGYGNACKPTGWMEGLFFDAPPLAPDGAFGWPQETDFGVRNGFGTRGTFSGRIDGARATGSLRLIGTGGPPRAKRCDTGVRTWRATSE